jgi:hypothetical protein
VEIKAPATSADNTLTLPNGNGSSNQVLTTDGSGGLTFAAPQLSTDTTPQLGGDLDVNGNDIVTTSNGDIDLDPNGSGQVVFKGNSTRGSGAVKLNCENNSHGILVKGPPHSAGANYTLTLPNDTGTSGQLLTTNGSGVTSWSTVNASPTFEATASGSIANGASTVINSDGTVSQVVQDSATFASGSDVQWTTDDATYIASAFDSTNNKVVFIYENNDQSSVIYGVVATVTGSNNSISYGTPVALTGTGCNFPDICFDSNAGKFLLVYRNGSSDGASRVLTVSGTSISAGSEVTYQTDNAAFNKVAFDPDTNKCCIIYWNVTQTRGECIVGTISGTSVSYGSTNNFNSNISTYYPAIAYDTTADKFVCAYADDSNSNGVIFTARIVGTDVFFGALTVFQSGEVDYNDLAYLPSADRTILSYKSTGGAGGQGFTKAISVSGTSVSVTSTVTFHNSGDVCDETSVVADLNAQKFVVVWKEGSKLEYKSAVVSSGTISYTGSIRTLESAGLNHPSAVYDSNEQRVVVGYNKSSQTDGRALVTRTEYSRTNLTSNNFLGFSNGAFTNGQTASIHITGSINEAQSGLTIGERYHVQDDGSLATSAGNFTAVAGLAVAATKIAVRH